MAPQMNLFCLQVTLVLLFCCNLQMCLGFGAFQYNVASAPTPMSTVSGIVLNAGPYGGEVNHHTFQVGLAREHVLSRQQ